MKDLYGLCLFLVSCLIQAAQTDAVIQEKADSGITQGHSERKCHEIYWTLALRRNKRINDDASRALRDLLKDSVFAQLQKDMKQYDFFQPENESPNADAHRKIEKHIRRIHGAFFCPNEFCPDAVLPNMRTESEILHTCRTCGQTYCTKCKQAHDEETNCEDYRQVLEAVEGPGIWVANKLSAHCLSGTSDFFWSLSWFWKDGKK